MSMVHQLIKKTVYGSGGSGDNVTEDFHAQHIDDETGLFQVSLTAGTVNDVIFRGRLGNDHTWHTLDTTGTLTYDPDDLPSTVDSDTLIICPQMRAKLKLPNGATIVISIME
jgi:hypothetical protein